ncbi:hypothetical protein AG1IA_08146 [Rhizoctonia solani AG-1 IA]|uniref:Big-1 domain-containing protein n=1 Tax=Thanatephorus cucumeris (strain AG1-IA) TaxID=983506 RepID=L8WLZ2_THACA|nr:hypothetical protein AG1IA_08146 [Rhizoctonia solani AG-1 IA]
MVRFSSLAVSFLGAIAPLSFASPDATYELEQRQKSGTEVRVRIEGINTTIFEGIVKTNGRDVTTKSGGTHHCDGTNNGMNPVPGPTCTSALADVAAYSGVIVWDGTVSQVLLCYTYWWNFSNIVAVLGFTPELAVYSGSLLSCDEIQDFDSTWFIQVGGCQQQVAAGDTILWAFDAFGKAFFLKLDGPSTAKVGVPVQVRVTDGPSEQAISGASIAGYPSSISDSNGYTTVTFTSAGTKKIKAQRSDSLRSNALTITVSA